MSTEAYRRFSGPLELLEARESFLDRAYATLGLVDVEHWEDARFGKGTRAFFSDSVDGIELKTVGGLASHMYFDEVASTLRALMYAVGETAIRHPLLGRPSETPLVLTDRTVYDGALDESPHERRYAMYYGFAVQAFYNFLDRLGDLVYAANPAVIDLGPKDVYFAKVVDQLGKLGVHGQGPEWLIAFKRDHYGAVNEPRIREVHYLTARTRLRHAFIAARSDREALKELEHEREGWHPRMTSLYRESCPDLLYHACLTAKQLSRGR